MNTALLELYSDYLISPFSLVTATGLSSLLDNSASHDRITRFLSRDEYTSRDLWALVKPTERHGSATKNEHLRQMPRVCQQNQLCYRYALVDNGFSAEENMVFIKVDMCRDFIMALKSNRTVALTPEGKRQGRFVRVDALPLEEGTVVQGHIKGVPFPVMLAKQVFTNKDGSSGVLYLASSDLQITYDRITTLYQKRWGVEVFHKSVKSNAGLARSRTHTVRTQSNHFFASIYAFFKLELLKLEHQANHFALRSKLYIKALQASFAELQLNRPI